MSNADDAPDTCGLRVEQLLLDALKHLRQFDRFPRGQLRAGLAELLGIGERSWKNANERFDNAAIEMGYASGESLRQTQRKVAGRLIWEECLAQLAEQLVALANEARFTYTGKFAQPVVSSRPIGLGDVRRTPTDDYDSTAQALALLILAELQAAFTYGVELSVSTDRLPTITLIAAAAFPDDGAILQQVEALLRWAIDDREPDEMRRTGIIELLEIGKLRGLELNPRRDRAAPFFGYKAGFNFNWYGPGVELPIFNVLKEALIDLAIDVGVTTTGQTPT
jgi:hypothetical protein